METQSVNQRSINSPVAVLGGTFDPVHHGHLRLAIDLAEKLNLDNIRLMPGYQPVHRDRPSATAEQRLEMLKLAVANNNELTVDARELSRKGPSYTLLSLQEMRAEIGDSCPLFFILGEDAFSQFDQWHQWQQIIQYAHLLIAIRPGVHPEISAQLDSFVKQHEFKGEGFPTTAAGSLIKIDNVMLEIASSDIRQRLSENRSIRYLLPANVFNYINQQNIYQKP